jgi:hypothetical protein
MMGSLIPGFSNPFIELRYKSATVSFVANQ